MEGTLTRIAAPARDLLTLEEARQQCRVTDTSEDSLIADYITTVTDYLDARDGVLGEALVTQTWRWSLPYAPAGSIEIPLGPVQSIVAIGYVDRAGATQVFPSGNYRLAGSVIELVGNASWPSVDTRQIAFWVDFVAGYGEPSAVPETVRQLARGYVGELYNAREVTGDKPAEISPVFRMLFAAARSERGLF